MIATGNKQLRRILIGSFGVPFINLLIQIFLDVAFLLGIIQKIEWCHLFDSIDFGCGNQLRCAFFGQCVLFCFGVDSEHETLCFFLEKCDYLMNIIIFRVFVKREMIRWVTCYWNAWKISRFCWYFLFKNMGLIEK